MVGVVLCGWWWYESKIEWLGVWEIRRATGRAEYLRRCRRQRLRP